MKKTLFTLMLILSSALMLNAQSLTGKSWAAQLDDGQGHDVKMVMELNKGGDCLIALLAQLPMNKDGTKILVEADAAVPGTYTVTGKALNVNLAKGNAQVELNTKLLNSDLDAGTRKKLEGILNNELIKQKKDILEGMLECIPNMKNATIKTLTDTKLVIAAASGQEMEFVAVPD